MDAALADALSVILTAHLVCGLLIALATYKLRSIQRTLRILDENVSDVVGVLDLQGRYLWVSNAAVRVLGVPSKDLIGHYIFRGAIPGDSESLSLDKGRQVYTVGWGGSFIWVETVLRPRYDRGLLAGYTCSTRDVTRRMEAESLYRFLIKRFPRTSVILFNHHMRNLVVEGEFPRTVTLKSGNLDGLLFEELFPKDIQSLFLPYYLRTLAGESSQFRSYFRGNPYDIYSIPVTNGKGIIRAGVLLIVDVSEEEERTRILMEHTADLERSNRDLAQFASVSSHELKSPLRRIASFADLLRSEYSGKLSEEADEYLHHIHTGVLSLQKVIESILDYSRTQPDKSGFRHFDPKSLISEVLEELQLLLEELEVSVEIGNLPAEVWGDRTLIRRLLVNLIGNAAKFNTTGRKRKVAVSCDSDLADWVFRVEDNGPGLDNQLNDRLFRMFQRIQPDVEGTGIGLALCRKIADIHRGKVWFESKGPDQGCTFYFSLPSRNRN